MKSVLKAIRMLRHHASKAGKHKRRIHHGLGRRIKHHTRR